MIENRSSLGPREFDPADPFYSVSVIIPLYKGAKFIRRTLESILSQTVKPVEVIVVDDESPDDSAAIAKSFGDKVTVIRIPNGGASAARNFGASKAVGRWLAFCDQDDIWHEAKLEKQLRLVSECPDIHLVLTDWIYFADGAITGRSHLSFAPDNFWEKELHSAGFVVRQSITGKLSTFQPAITSSPIVLRECFLASGGFDLSVEWGAEDTCFHFRCLCAVPFGVVPEILMYYNRHPDAGSADTLDQLRKTVDVWKYIIASYPQAQPYKEELVKGVDGLQAELRECRRYARRQKLKRILRIK